jgi:hypothetical protein
MLADVERRPLSTATLPSVAAETLPVWLKWALQPLALLLLLSWLPTFAEHFDPRKEKGLFDFYQEWASAKNILAAKPPYWRQDYSAELHLGHKLKPGERLSIRYNAHPPAAVLVAIPLGWLSYSQAFALWNVGSVLCLAASLAIILWMWRIRIEPWMALPLLAWLSIFSPFVNQIAFGQWNSQLLLLLTLAWAFDKSNRPSLAGIALGTAIAMKFFPALVLVLWVCRGRWKASLTAVAVAAAWMTASVVVLGIPAWKDYLTVVLPDIATFRPAWMNISIAGFWSRLFVSSEQEKVVALVHAPWLADALTALCGLALVYLVAQSSLRAKTPEQVDDAFGKTLIAMVLMSPLSWGHSLLLLMQPMIRLLTRIPNYGPAWRWPALLLLFFTLPPITFHLQDWVNSGQLPRHLGPLHNVTLTALQCYGLLLFFWMQQPYVRNSR